ncbi:mini-chromosome maintenance complex-binding protein-like isoform X2 [Papaver somniferum]|uniref:mini-chromosome maintenance complex-binding protein-like isoform X2 n=1 Tax=Papaver somniferum TaxID=3469 RepID=UPI000E6F4E54|nr:mini-chromosome maintenance complex-binding protein-like isoform X2 [Papaver somniferum]
MGGIPFDCLANPLGAVRITFERAISSGSDPKTFNGKDWGAIEVFKECLFDQNGLSQVPILDSSTIGRIKPNSLVRFRGMVQDMLGNELYVGAFKDGSTWRTNKFTDVASFPMNSSSEMSMWERRLLYCVPVPGQSPWVVEASSSAAAASSEAAINRGDNWASQQGEKRRRDDDTSVDTMDCNISNHEAKGSPSSTKKMREDGLPCQAFQSHELEIGETSSMQSVIPDFDTKSLSCLVKIYDSPETELKLNDVFEFVGVFTFDPELVASKNETDDSDALFEDELVNLPPNKVPRLHCLIHKKITIQDFFCGSPVIERVPYVIRGIRESLVGYLTAVLGNDGVAAQSVLLHLLSQVHTRVDTVAVGKLSLNLTGFTKETVSVFGNQLNLAIQSLLPLTQALPLTVEYLNTASLAPKKDYKSNRLITGSLQLADGTHLILDETQLNPGTLNSTGVENVQILKSLMEMQKVEYDFEYYKLEMSSDVQLLVLSEGKSNILPADLVLPFQPSSVGSSLNADANALQAWRWYLATLRSQPHVIDPELQKVIENDLVEARQEDRSLGSNDFSRWLTMARLMSASFGETSLSLEHWQMVKELERLRKNRLK